VCVSVCVDKNWAVLRRFFQSLHVPCGAKQGRAGAGQGGQGSRCGGAEQDAISIKEILGGKLRDLHLIKQKYNLKNIFFHYKTYLKNYNIFEKENRKIEKINKYIK